MAIKPFIGTQPVQIRTRGYMYMGAECEYTEESWDYYEVRIPGPGTPAYNLLANYCSKREAWTIFTAYTKRNPSAVAQIRHQTGQSDMADTNYDEEVVWSTDPAEVGSIGREAQAYQDAQELAHPFA